MSLFWLGLRAGAGIPSHSRATRLWRQRLYRWRRSCRGAGFLLRL